MSLGAAQTLTPKLDHRPQKQPVLPPVYELMNDLYQHLEFQL